jgi:hypothetical protein
MTSTAIHSHQIQGAKSDFDGTIWTNPAHFMEDAPVKEIQSSAPLVNRR